MGHYLHFDPEELKANFSTRGITFTHSLADSGLFELGRLAEAAQWLYDNMEDHHIYLTNTGETAGEGISQNKVKEVSIADTVRGIEQNRVWTVIKSVQDHPDYAGLVEAVRAEFAEVIPAFIKPDAYMIEGWVFITSPNGITPYHIDKEWGLIAQIRGAKHYTAYDKNDPSILSPQELEQFYKDNDFNAAKYHPDKEKGARHIVLQPGDAVTQPRHTPHLISVEDEFSITFGLSLFTVKWANEEPVYHMNRILRRAGFSPQVVGVRPAADLIKGTAFRSIRKARHLTGRLLPGKTPPAEHKPASPYG